MKRGIPIYFNRLIKTIVSSTGALAFDLILLFIFVEFFKIYYLFAAAFAYLVATSSNYFICRYWGFSGTKSKIIKSYFMFIAFGIFYIVAVLILLKFFVESLQINYLIGRLLASIIIGIFVFILNYIFTFNMGNELPFRKKKKILKK